MTVANKITIGCDPEYGILKDGRLITPNQVFNSASMDAAFGIDGSGRVAELRPQYATDPKGLVTNITKTLQEGMTTHPSLLAYKLKAGSCAVDEPIGGHIHFGHASLKQVTYARRVADALDKTAAVLVLMVEDHEEAMGRRIGSSYGSAGSGSYRDQPWGMEYRVLPSWLTTPDEAMAILSLCYIVAAEWHDSEIMEEAGSLPAFDSQAFRECDKLGLLYYLKPIIQFIRKLPKYDEYEEHLMPLFKLIKSRSIWSCDKNMIDTWHLKAAKKKEPEYV